MFCVVTGLGFSNPGSNFEYKLLQMPKMDIPTLAGFQ
jgi:hypothetical protein